MKAVRIIAGRCVVSTDAAAPLLPPGHALLRPVRLAVAIEDSDQRADRTIGREFVAIVERVEPRAGNPGLESWVGKRVVGSANVPCGACDRCRGGLSVHCRTRKSLGDPDLPGCFAELFVLPASNLVEVPSHVPDDDAVLAPAIAAAAHVARALPPTSRPFISVLGDNAVGLLTALLLSRRRDSVRMLTGGAAAAMVCEKWGLKHRPVAEAGRRHDQDVVIDASGASGGLAIARELVRPRARIIVLWSTIGARVGLGLEPSGGLMEDIAENELEVVGIRGEDFVQAVSLLGEGSIKTAPLISARYSFEQAPLALRAASEPGTIKAIVSPPPRADANP